MNIIGDDDVTPARAPAASRAHTFLQPLESPPNHWQADLQLAGVDNFNVSGTIHVIVNNQISFTTNPTNSCSTPYASNLGKAFNAPIFHCNCNDPIVVSPSLETAIEWRLKWGTAVG